MQEDFLPRVEALFYELVDLPPEERPAYLDEHCAGDPALRAEVESLLTHLDDGPLEPAWKAEHAGTEAPSSALGEKQIGPYRLLSVIGEGGFGVVYLARQDEPVRRTVALKVLKPGMDTRQVVARFEAERQAMAMMDHPGIARVFDAGATERGLPYFVMEHVPGEWITHYSDRLMLSTEERLALFMDVCDAVQHAHQRGVIHRDLKPSNVLVETMGDRVQPKIIDFGIAKALRAPLTERTLYTETGQMMGTPEYMSPEQAEMSGLNVDTRTDIYSLGVILYELLTGTLPFDPKSLREGTPGEIQQRLREEEPERPSTRLSSVEEESKELARKRRTDPRMLRRRLRGDLDWITMKALEKDRARRYASASEFAADVKRHLRHEPVLAGPPGAGYRIKKFIKRNRAVVLATGLVTLALVAGIIGTTWGLIQARTERDAAKASARQADREKENAEAAKVREEAQRTKAEQEAERAKAANAFLVHVLSQANPELTLEPDLRVRAMLDRAANEVGRFFKEQPATEAEVRWGIGRSYVVYGEYRKAEAQLEKALDYYSRFPAGEDLRLFQTLLDLGMVRSILGNTRAAARHFPEAFYIGKRLLTQDRPESVAVLYFSWRSADLSAFKSRIHEFVNRFIDRFEPGHPLLRVFSDFLCRGGRVASNEGRFVKSEWFFREARRIQEKIFPPAHPVTSRTIWEIGQALLRQGERTDEACDCFGKSLDLMRRSLPSDHWRIALMKCNMASLIDVPEGRYEEAEGVLLENFPRVRDVLDSENPHTLAVLGHFVKLYGRWNRPEKATPYHVQLAMAMKTSWNRARRLFDKRHPELAAHLARLRLALAAPAPGIHLAWEKVEAQGRAALDVAEPADKLALIFYSDLLDDWGLRAENGLAAAGEAMLKEALAIRRRVLPKDHRKIAVSLFNLARVQEVKGKFEEGAKNAAECVAIQTRRHGGDDWRTCVARSLLGGCLAGQGHLEEAERHLVESYRILMESLGRHDVVLSREYHRILDLYEAWGRRNRTLDTDLKLARMRAFRPRARTFFAYFNFGLALMNRGEYTAAYRAHAKAIELNPHYEPAHCQAAVVAALQYRRDTACRHSQEVFRLIHGGGMGEVPYILAGVRGRIGNLDEAIFLARKAIELDEKKSAFFSRLAVYLRREDLHNPEVLQALRKALANDVDYAYAQAAIAYTALRRGELSAAINEARKAVQMNPSHRWGIRLAQAVLGRALFLSGEEERGREYLRRAANQRLRPGALGLKWLGEAFAAAGRSEEARAILERQVRDWPEDPFAWDALAWFLITAEGLGEEARRAGLEAARKAVQFSHRQGPIMLATLAEAQFVNGQVDDAIATATEAKDLMAGRNFPFLSPAEVEQRLERYRKARHSREARH